MLAVGAVFYTLIDNSGHPWIMSDLYYPNNIFLANHSLTMAWAFGETL